MIKTEFGWVNTFPTTIDSYWLFFYYFSFGIVSIILLFRWLRKIQSNVFLKKDVIKFKLSFYLTVFLGIATDVLPDILGIKMFPKIAVVILFIPTATMFLTLKGFGLFLEKEKTTPEFLTYGNLMTNDRRRLFILVGHIFITGAAISFLIGFFIMRGPLEIELLLSSGFALFGILTILIPVVTKNQANQNTIFLLIAVAGTIFYSLKCFDTGATTVWGIYVLFFLITVILGGKVQSIIFALVNIAVQVVYFIIQPEIVVAVGRTDYASRIAVIALTFAITQFLMSLQSVRMKKYEESTKEQSVLERISSNFISYSKENADEKLNEMFEMSAEILNFDYAYLLEISSDCEDIALVSKYVNPALADDSSPRYSEVEAKEAILQIVESIIADKRPVVYDDVEGISIREHEAVRNYFMSRGINSFSAFPAIVDDRVHGILFVEYCNRVDKHIWEDRQSIFKILTNVLADARKKLLYEKRLHEFAYFDVVTKMANLNMLKKTLEPILNNEEEPKIAILDIEIENLKPINDTFGHDIGTQVLIKSASTLENLFPDRIIISRTGSKEFIVALPYSGNEEEITNRAKEVINVFSQPLLTDTGVEALFVIINIGISLYPQDGKDVISLLESAELAGNEAEQSDDKIVFYTSKIREYITETALLTNRLFSSLQNDEFYLEFQPQINIATEKTAGVEALLRLTPENGKILEPPNRFIPILETTGLINDVGAWVLKESIAAHQRLVMKGFKPLRFSVNISAVQLQRHDFVDSVSKIIEESQIDPKYIELEITEGALSENISDTIEKISELKKLGISVAIDDFGKGYSSLHRLEAIPFDRIKIDKSITDNIDSERRKTIITETVISLAKAFRAYTTIEGVETENQVEFLKELGCDEIQGFYFSKPLSIDKLEAFLKNEI